jgi:hypothetical protein
MDGNNSLKRFHRRERVPGLAGVDVPGESKERADSRKTPGTYYLEREEVDVWGEENLENMLRDVLLEPASILREDFIGVLLIHDTGMG